VTSTDPAVHPVFTPEPQSSFDRRVRLGPGSPGLPGRRQLIPAGYVRRCTQAQSRPPGPANYGYHWWVISQDEPGGFFARGFGGQCLLVLPSLDLVVVITCHEAFRPDRDAASTLIGDVILQATRR